MRRRRQQRERQKGNRLLGQTTTAITVQLRREKASFHVLWRT